MSFKYEKIGLRRDRNLADLIDNEQGLTNLLNDLALPGEKFVAADLKVIDNLSETNVTVDDFFNFANAAPESTQIRYASVLVAETTLIQIPFTPGTTFIFNDVLYEVINILQPVPPEVTGNVNGYYQVTITIQTAVENAEIQVGDNLNIANQPFTVIESGEVEKTQNVFTVSPLLTINDQVEFFRINTGSDPLFGVGRGPDAVFYPMSEIDSDWIPETGFQYLNLDSSLFNSPEPVKYTAERFWDNGTFSFENSMFDITSFDNGYGGVQWEGYISLDPYALVEELNITTNGHFVFEEYDDRLDEWKANNFIIDGTGFYLGVPYQYNPLDEGNPYTPLLAENQFIMYDSTGASFNLLNPVPLGLGLSSGAIIRGYFHPNGQPVQIAGIEQNLTETIVTIKTIDYIVTLDNGETETRRSPAGRAAPEESERDENTYIFDYELKNILDAPPLVNNILPTEYLVKDFKVYTSENTENRDLFLSQKLFIRPKDKLVNAKRRVRITAWFPPLFNNAQYQSKIFAITRGETGPYNFTKIHNQYNKDDEATNPESLNSFNENVVTLSNPFVEESITINDLLKIEYEPTVEVDHLNSNEEIENKFQGVSEYSLITPSLSVASVLDTTATPFVLQTITDFPDNTHPDVISPGDIALMLQTKKRRRASRYNGTVKDSVINTLPTGQYSPVNSADIYPIVNDDWISGTLVFGAENNSSGTDVLLSDKFIHSCPDIHYIIPTPDIIARQNDVDVLINDLPGLEMAHESQSWKDLSLNERIPSCDVIYFKNYGVVDILSEGSFNGQTGLRSLTHEGALTGISTSPKSITPGQLVQTYYYPSDDFYSPRYAQVIRSLDVSSSFNYNPVTGVFTIPDHGFDDYELVRVSWNDVFAPIDVGPPEGDPDLYTQRYVLLKKVEGSNDDFELWLNPTLSAGAIGAVVQEFYNANPLGHVKWIPQIEVGFDNPHIIIYSMGTVHGFPLYQLRTIDSRITSETDPAKNVALPERIHFPNRGKEDDENLPLLIEEVSSIQAVVIDPDAQNTSTFRFILSGGSADDLRLQDFMLNGWPAFQDRVFQANDVIETVSGLQVTFFGPELPYTEDGQVIPKATTIGEFVVVRGSLEDQRRIFGEAQFIASVYHSNGNSGVKYRYNIYNEKFVSPLQTRTNLAMTVDTIDFDETTGEVAMTVVNTYNIPQSQMLTSEAYNGYDNLGIDVDPDPKFIHVIRHDKGLYDASTYEFCKDIISIPLTQDVPAGANVLTVADTTNLNIGQVVQFAGFIPTAATIVNKTQTTITISASTLRELKRDYVLTVADDNLQDYELCSVSLNTAPPFEGTEDGLKTVTGNEDLIVNDVVFDGLILNNQPVSQISVDENGNIDYSYGESIDITYVDQETDGKIVYKLAIKP